MELSFDVRYIMRGDAKRRLSGRSLTAAVDMDERRDKDNPRSVAKMNLPFIKSPREQSSGCVCHHLRKENG